jgi:hypothetical protein
VRLPDAIPLLAFALKHAVIRVADEFLCHPQRLAVDRVDAGSATSFINWMHGRRSGAGAPQGVGTTA